MRLNTKQKREESREYQFNYLITNGYTREDYKDLIIFEKDLTLKVFSGTGANHILFCKYRTPERVEEIKTNLKTNHDSRAAFKAEQKKNKKLSGAAATAAAIREELKQFTGVKFTVRSSNFAGGDSVDVSYTDGPTITAVENVINKYQYGHFNGMEDIYEYSNRIEGLPQAKFVSAHRSRSEEATEAIKETLKAKWSAEYLEGLSEYEFNNLIYKEFAPLDLSAPKAEEVQTPAIVQTNAGEVTLIDYSDKSFAVIGDTRPIKDKLKELGGKFNFRLTCGAGWVFPKTKLEAVQNALSNATPTEPTPEPETTIKDEINKTLDFFIETDRKLIGEISESTKTIFEVQGQQLPEEKHFNSVQIFDNLQDITSAAKSGQMISLCNLSDIVNNKQTKQPTLF